MAMSDSNRKPRVIILGGCGFIGRNLVEYLLDNDLVSFLRVVDKVPPQTAWLNAKHQQLFEHPLLEFKSANLINAVCNCVLKFMRRIRHAGRIRIKKAKFFSFVQWFLLRGRPLLNAPPPNKSWQASTSNSKPSDPQRFDNVDHWVVFSDDRQRCEFCPSGHIQSKCFSCQSVFISDDPIDYVINCAGETKSGQTDPVYKEGIYKLSINCAQQSAKLLVDRYVEISAGNFNASGKHPLKEEDAGEPWTFVAKYKLQVENDLKNIPNLKYTVLRPAIVYGCGDRSGLAPRLVVGAVYKHLGEMMKLLWGPDLHMNTVHVRDLARAIWHVVNRPETIGQTYNVVDEGDSTQGSISAMVSELFNINHDYWGTALSTLAKTDMSSVVEEVNDKHMGPWAEACNKDGVENSPLSPYIDQELLYNKNLHLLPGKLLSTGFTYLYPKLTKDTLKEVLDDYVSMKIFPHSLVL